MLIDFPFAKFTLGQVLFTHRDSRGVVVGIDSTYGGSEEWYQRLCKGLNFTPPKNKPWYNLLLDKDTVQLYLPEDLLKVDNESTLYPIAHPDLWKFFDTLEDGLYISKRMVH